MEAIFKCTARLKSLLSLKKDSSRSQTLSVKGNRGTISGTNGSNNISVNRNQGNTLIGDGSTQQNANTIINQYSEKKSVLDILKYWMTALDQGDYRSHSEIVNLFCRDVIPFIQKHSGLQVLVNNWRAIYEEAVLKSGSLQKKVLEDSERAFRGILQAIKEPSELAQRKISDIEEILSGDRSRVGYTSWPLYREVYRTVKELLEILLAQGGEAICARYAKLGTTTKYVGTGKGDICKVEPCILEYTFALDVQRAVDYEEIFDPKQVQEAFIVWKYFEVALYFWEIHDLDIERELNTLFETHPIKALGTRRAWMEIVQAKRPDKIQEAPHIFKEILFKKGLRTLVDEITTFLETAKNKD